MLLSRCPAVGEDEGSPLPPSESWKLGQMAVHRRGVWGREVTTPTHAPFTRLIHASTDRQNRQPPLPNKQHVRSLS